MQLNTYLNFNGQCKAAFEFYEQCLEGKIVAMMTHGDSPIASKFSPEWKDKIMHARLVVKDQTLMGSDAPPEHYQKPQGFSVALILKDAGKAERVFSALAKNGKVQMPLQETFWAVRFGMLVDQFGIPWMINCEKPA
jgi:PhnB protein